MKVLRVALLTSSILAPALALAAPLAPTALPTGASVVAGQATVSRSGASLLVTETSDKAIINWQSFNIGSAGSVTFAQPGAGSIALNRVAGADPSRIDGALRANGQIVLINPNGLVFGAGATVDVGGIVASSLNISDADFLGGKLVFNRTGSGAAVVNEGAIHAAKGGYVALLGSQLANRGMIQANFGTVALAAGDRVTMTLAGAGLVGISVDPAAVKTQIDQGGAIVASDGSVWLSAKAQSALLGGVINASGSIEANSLTAKGGVVVLDATGPITVAGADISATGATGGGAIKIGGLDNASTNVGQGAVLDASATVSGPGGAVETSGQSLGIGQATIRTAGAGGGAAGSWLLDPYDLTIDATAATSIDTALASGVVTIQTSANSTLGAGVVNTSGSGDIIIAAPIAWSANTTLILDAYHSVIANAAITASGATSGLIIATNDGGTGGQLTFNAPVTMPTTGSVTINSNAYTLINTASGLQTIGATGNYALTGTISLSAISNLPPLGGAGFTGVLEGLGNIISGLTIVGTTATNIGMFTLIATGGLVENLALTGGSVQATTNNSGSGVGMLAGENDGAIYNVSSAGLVAAGAGSFHDFAGGLVGTGAGTIDHSHSSATVTGGTTNTVLAPAAGGLVGQNGGTISNSYATGAVTGGGGNSLGGDAGGLVGSNLGLISASYATGVVTGGAAHSNNGTGGRGAGLVGENDGIVTGSYATGAATGGASTVKGTGGYGGGLVGYNTSEIDNSYATGAVTGGASLVNGHGGLAGGLVGYNGNSISNSYATGLVTGGAGSSAGNIGASGGLVAGSNASPLTAMTGDYWNVTTTGQAADFYTVGVTGLTTVQWLTQGPGVAGSTSGWNFTDTWLQGYPYPVLKALPYVMVSASASGTYGGTLAISSGVTATDQNGAGALGLINIGGMTVVGGSTGAAGTLTGLGGAGAIVTAPSAYQIAYAPITATVNPATLIYSVANASSTYGTLATPGAATLSGFVNGDGPSSVSGTVGVGDGVNPVTLTARTAAGLYNETVTGLTGAKAADYVIADAGNTAGALTIGQLAIILSGSRDYDGSATVAAAALSISNLLGCDDLILGGSATVSAKDAGSQAIASAAGLTLSNPNYTVVGASGSVTINPLAVTLTGSRDYNGSASVAASVLSASNLVDGDSLTIGGGAALAAKDAGSEAITSTSGLTLSNPNYTLTGATGSVTINPLAVVLTGSRDYNGSATVAAGILSASNLIDGDSLTIGGSAALAAKDAGPEGITSTSGLTLSNPDYTLTGATGSVTINPLAVVLTGSRDYNGSAAIAGGALSASNLIDGDSLTIGGSAALAAKDAGAQAITSAAGLTLSNPNYTVVGASGSVSISPLAVDLTGARTYDGTTVVSGNVLSVSGVVFGDSLTITGSAVIAAKDAGSEAIVSTSGVTLSNANYTLSGLGSVTISPLAVTLTGSRTYDGTASIAAGLLSISGLIDGDSLTLGGSATLASKNAGGESIASIAGLSLSNANYAVNGASSSVTINPLAVTLTGARTYDGSAVIAGSSLSASNLIAGDSLTLGGSGALAAKDAGSESIASTAGLTLSNANYTLAGATGSAVISPALLTITADNAHIALGAGSPPLTVSYSGLVGGDTAALVQGLIVTTSVTPQSAPGDYAIVPGGAAAPNYRVAYVDGVLTVQSQSSSNAVVGTVIASVEASTTPQPAFVAPPIITGDGVSGGTGTVVLLNPDGGEAAVLLIADQPIADTP